MGKKLPQLTVFGLFSFGDSTGRRPPDLLDVETSTPEQLSANPPEEDRTTLDLQRIAMRAHQEARQSIDLRKDLARRVMPSDGPYQKGDRVFVWHKDESKKKIGRCLGQRNCHISGRSHGVG